MRRSSRMTYCATRLARWFGAGAGAGYDAHGHLWARWIFLRALGVVFFSAFYSLAFQIRALIGPEGILPARLFLARVAEALPGVARFHQVPSLLWLSASTRALDALVAVGLAASVLLVIGVWPRAMIAIAGVLFLSFVSAAQVFSSYQSDGMLLEAALLALFFAPRGLWPGLGAAHPPSRASLWLLRWEWFRIYFASGVGKIWSGDPEWRALRAMDHYYENGPLPTWLGWWAHQLPRGAHTGAALFTLVVELALVWLVLFGRRGRMAIFFIVTPLQIAIIATANYAFLNYLVLFLGILLLDDRALAPAIALTRMRLPQPRAISVSEPSRWRLFGAAFVLSWIAYATTAVLLFRYAPGGPLEAPARWIAPLRIANRYGLFEVMTPARYEIEFQGTTDGTTWLPYAFRYKPQDPMAAPGIYAPYQPRFEWNLWFASLDTWRRQPWVVRTSARLLDRDEAVLALFAKDPFDGKEPRAVRVVLWQYWFTDRATRATTGAWWRRELVGPYCPTLARSADGTIEATTEDAAP